MLNGKPTNKYKHFNHFHELDDDHQLVDFGDGEFIANKEAIPLLKALNELGLRTRTHHVDKEKNGFVSILLDNANIEVRKVHERDSTRTKYNGKYEVLIMWRKSQSQPEEKKENKDKKIKWEFEETKGDWTIRGHYNEPKNIEFLYKGEHFDYLTFPGYKIWNIPAHLDDFIASAEAERKRRKSQEKK